MRFRTVSGNESAVGDTERDGEGAQALHLHAGGAGPLGDQVGAHGGAAHAQCHEPGRPGEAPRPRAAPVQPIHSHRRPQLLISTGASLPGLLTASQPEVSLADEKHTWPVQGTSTRKGSAETVQQLAV